MEQGMARLLIAPVRVRLAETNLMSDFIPLFAG
jgi:hypothetical protein